MNCDIAKPIKLSKYSTRCRAIRMKFKLQEQEFQERYRFWTDKRISQLSYHNNLLLTLAIALISYLGKEPKSIYKKFIFNCSASIDWKLVCILFLFISMLCGISLSLSRLYDLRLTSNKLLIKKRLAIKYLDIKVKDLQDVDLITSMISLLSVITKYNKDYKIPKRYIDEIDSKKLEEYIYRLSQKAKDLGELSYTLMICQTLSMLLSMLFLTIDIVF